MQQGTVRWYDLERGFGFLAPDDGSDDIFVHVSQVQGEGAARALREGRELIPTVTCRGAPASNARRDRLLPHTDPRDRSASDRRLRRHRPELRANRHDFHDGASGPHDDAVATAALLSDMPLDSHEQVYDAIRDFAERRWSDRAFFRMLNRLLFLAAEPQRVFTKDELLRDVWGFRSMGRTRTLDSHACRLRHKLGAAGGRYVVNVWGVGYRLLDGFNRFFDGLNLVGDRHVLEARMKQAERTKGHPRHAAGPDLPD